MHVYNSNIGQMQLHMPQALNVDNFAGGGGASLGMEIATGRPVDIAINHNPIALAIHEANHPDTHHYCESVWDVDPIKACGGLPVDNAWFSPDCTHHSKARGGKPKKKEIRGLAWVTVKWAIAVRPKRLYLENVEEFRDWGPLDTSGKAIKERKGETFDGFIKMLTTGIEEDHPAVNELIECMPEGFDISSVFDGLGYSVDYKELRASKYGIPTTRKRFFLVGRSDGTKVVWPEITHGAADSDDVLSGNLQSELTTGEHVIDWSIPCKSIFNRPKSLADNTLRRIARGIQKFVIDNPKPYIVRIGQTGFGGSGMQYDINTPLTTITTKVEHCLIVPVLEPVNMQKNADACSRFMAQYNDLETVICDDIKNICEPENHDYLTASHLVKMRNGCTGQPTDKPAPTITAGGMHLGEVRTFLVKYYGAEKDGHDVNKPLHTVPSKDRFGLVSVRGVDYQIVDIGMRMLEPHELFAAQGFPSNYNHSHLPNGKRLSKADQVKMCGNSVPPLMAAAVIKANLPDAMEQEKAA